MTDMKIELFNLWEKKLDEWVHKMYGVSLSQAMGGDPKISAIIRAVFEMFYDFPDTEEGQKALFDGWNSVTMIYKCIARHDYAYRYTGHKPLNPYELIPPNLIETIEKDCEACQHEGCASGSRPLWCVDEYEIERFKILELCNFCASQHNVATLDKCLSKSEECVSCPNSKIAHEISGSDGFHRDRKIVPIK